MTNPTKTASKAEFARLSGRTRQSIGDLVSRGKITALPDGRIPVELGLLQLQSVRGYSSISSPASAPSSAPAAAADDIPSYARSRAEREGFAAQREHMAMQREARELLPAAEVHDALETAVLVLRTDLEQLPERLAYRLAAIGADEAGARNLLATAIDDALHALATRFAALENEAGA